MCISPSITRLNNTLTERQRLGLSSSFQYKFTKALTLTVDLDYLHLGQPQPGRGNRDPDQRRDQRSSARRPGLLRRRALINGNDLLNHYQSHSENDFTNSDAGDTSFLLSYNPGGRFRGLDPLCRRFRGCRTRLTAFADNLATTLESGAAPRSAGAVR